MLISGASRHALGPKKFLRQNEYLEVISKSDLRRESLEPSVVIHLIFSRDHKLKFSPLKEFCGVTLIYSGTEEASKEISVSVARAQKHKKHYILTLFHATTPIFL